MNKNIIITISITIVIGVIFLLYGIAFLTAIPQFDGLLGLLFFMVIIAVLAGLVYVIIYNMRERIREIKEEEKDDISKY